VAALAACVHVLAGCVFFRSPEVPMRVVAHERHAPERARGLVVLLPGIFDAPEDFGEKGVLALIRRADPRWNAVAVDAHLGYYKGKHNSIVERLEVDVIAPARRRGYRQVWLLGVSLGGFGALVYASRFPVDGMIVISPFLGPEEIVDEVRRAGGLASWSPERDPDDDGETRFFRSVWSWLRGYPASKPRPPLFLGYGGEDKFAADNRVLAKGLPRSRVVMHPKGDHDWESWTALLGAIVPPALGRVTP
jgi:pimeloyl-ACP methyl ester carboxylesterase